MLIHTISSEWAIGEKNTVVKALGRHFGMSWERPEFQWALLNQMKAHQFKRVKRPKKNVVIKTGYNKRSHLSALAAQVIQTTRIGPDLLSEGVM